MRKIFLFFIVLSIITGLGAAAHAQSIKESTGAGDVPVGFSLALTNTFGVNPDNPLYAIGLAPSVKYTFTSLNLTASADLEISKELTNADYTTLYREIVLSDTRLRLYKPDIYKHKPTGIALSGLLALSLPTSKFSQYETKRLGLTIGAGLMKQLYGFVLAYRLRFGKAFHKYTTAEIKPENSVSLAVAEAVRAREADLLNTGLTNIDLAVSNSFSIGYVFFEELVLSTDLAIVNAWAYKIADDIPRGERFAFTFNADLSYQPWDHLGFSVGWVNYTPQLRPDSQSYYNPFWVNHYNNYTTLYLNITGTI
ncbi:MAG: hypothetical protein ABIH03_13030 [Pseudomonadota bacterium]